MPSNRRNSLAQREGCSQIQTEQKLQLKEQVKFMNAAEQQLEKEKARLRGKEVALDWMRKRIHDFAPCDANSKLIGEWLEKNNLPLTEENLDKAAAALGGQLAKPQAATPSATPEPTLDEVAPVPSYMAHIRTKADIAKISNERMKELRRGPHGEALKNRINAVMRGVKPASRPSVVVSPQVSPPDDGLPPIPVGADASQWPNAVDEITRMSRDSFRLLYHSKRFGEAFRERVGAIYAREGRRR